MESSMFEVGQEVSFTYNEKYRRGTVERVRESVLTLKVVEAGQTGYRSFKYAKMGPATWYGNIIAG